MTVTYTAEVATCRWGSFLKLLRRWKGSIYKLVWIDLLVFLFIYYLLNILYRHVLEGASKQKFEDVVRYCKVYLDLIPISFVLGFYVSIVMTRWWNQYITIPFPDPLAVFVSASIHGQDEGGRMMRRTIMRYVCLCVTLTFTNISPRVKKRFPTLEHFVEAGLLQDSEKDVMSDLNTKHPKYSKHWMPIVWAASIITRARKEGRIRDDFAVKTMIDELNKFRGMCGLLMSYDTISVPLVYTQVVTLAVYTYFLTAVMGHQEIEKDNLFYFPVFTTLQFFFYMGWLKVAESLINPFGDDDDDFEVNWMIDRNLQVSYLIVDEMHHSHPELVRDQYWDEVFPEELPYTLASEPFRESHPQPSTANIAVPRDEQEIVQPPSSVKVDDSNFYNDMSSAIMFTAKPSSANLRRGPSQASNIGASVPDSISRVSSVTNMLKKIFTREDSRSESRAETSKDSPVELQPTSGFQASRTGGGSPNSLAPPLLKPGSLKLADQVIEEVDEQSTITSMKGVNDPRPSVMNIFSPPKPSQPISVPQSLNRYGEPQDSADLFSLSAPTDDRDSNDRGAETISIGSETDDEHEDDEFTKLRKKRIRERKGRLMLNLARSISINPEGECLLPEGSSTAGTPQARIGPSTNSSTMDDIFVYENPPQEPRTPR